MSWFCHVCVSWDDKTWLFKGAFGDPFLFPALPRAVPSPAGGTEVTPQETQRAIWRRGWCSHRVFVHGVGDSSTLVGTLATTEGIRMTPTGWVSPWGGCHHWVSVTMGWVSLLGAAGGTGGVSGPFPNLSLPGAAPGCAGLGPAKITGAGRGWLGALGVSQTQRK